jgi:hypothetical protein
MALSTTPTTSQQSILLTLPAELRTQIYEDTLLDAKVIEVVTVHARRQFGSLPDKNWQPPKLLQTCRQIRNEARSIYYARNRFAIPRDKLWDFRLLHWLKALEAVDAASIKHVRTMSLKDRPPSEAIAQFNHFRRVWLGRAGIAFPKESMYTAVEVSTGSESVFVDGERLSDLITPGWLDLRRLENAVLSKDGYVVAENLGGLDEEL